MATATAKKPAPYMTYGKAIEHYPVTHGEVWRVGERVTLACLNVEDEATVNWWTGQRRDVFYSDPPWNNGLASAFANAAGTGRKANLNRLIQNVADIAAAAEHVFVETTIDDTMNWRGHALNAAIKCKAEYVVSYGTGVNKRSSRLWYSGPASLADDVSGLRSPALIAACFKSLALDWKAITVADPCCGIGMTMVEALKLGAHFVGSELQPRKLANALQTAARMTGAPPKRI